MKIHIESHNPEGLLFIRETYPNPFELLIFGVWQELIDDKIRALKARETVALKISTKVLPFTVVSVVEVPLISVEKYFSLRTECSPPAVSSQATVQIFSNRLKFKETVSQERDKD